MTPSAPLPPHERAEDLGATELRSLDPRAIRLWRLAAAGWAAAGVLAIVAFRFLFDNALSPAALIVLIAAVGATGGALAALWVPARYRAWGYRVREDDVVIRRGVLWRALSVVPHARIQHVDTRRGPLERPLGLARVVVYTAGTQGARLTIPALAAEEAEHLRDRLAELGAGDAGL